MAGHRLRASVDGEGSAVIFSKDKSAREAGLLATIMANSVQPDDEEDEVE